jgi:ATP-dependent phosphofructokinase / diphosphate-dependent phosphofructokinase
VKRIGLLTGGGDAPGLNAVIRAVVYAARRAGDGQVLGIRNGFDGLIDPEAPRPLVEHDVRGLLSRGGTILGAANRGNPFARRAHRDGLEVVEDHSDRVLENLERLQLDALIVVGGDGTLRISRELAEKGCPVVGVPKTIDNDVGGTDVTFGYDTAVNTAVEALDRLHTTAESHHRVMVVELMGHQAGFLALAAGVAGGADGILIPEIPFGYEPLLEAVSARRAAGRSFSVLAVAEGAYPVGGEQVIARPGDAVHFARLGGVGAAVAERLAERSQLETRVTVLGHLQRGGSPSAFDRWLATRFGVAAVALAMRGIHGRMVALRGREIVDVPLAEALAVPKRVDPQGSEVAAARALGIAFG